MPRLVVVGGGISGLAAAWTAAADPALDVLVLERDPEVGGKARTARRDGWLIEEGPTAYQSEPEVERLVEECGLGAARLDAAAASARRFVVRGGRPREIDPHPLRFARSGLLGPLDLLRVACEPLVPGKRGDAEESVWSFAARRLGRGAADRLIAPMVLGVFAGDAKRISLPAAFPRMAALERRYGSLIKAMIAGRKERRARGGGGPAGPGGALRSFRDGLQSLPRALAGSGRFAVRTGAAVTDLRQLDGGWELRLAGGEAVAADAVILAVEPGAIAGLIRPLAPQAAQELAAVPMPPVVVAAFGYGAAVRQALPTGFGMLVPRGEGARILGCLWDTHLFPGRSPDGALLVRSMLGGAVDPGVAALDDVALVDQVRRDLRRLLGVREAPEFVHLARWDRAIPQYEVGHLDRVARVEAAVAGLPGLFLAGNGLHGVSFGKAAATGVRAAESASGYLTGVAAGV